MKYVYIAGAGHSGSTLLDLAISNQSNVISLGEFRHVHLEWMENNICSCGEPMRSCPLWSEVLVDFSEEELFAIAARDYHRNKGPRDLPERFVDIYPRFLDRLVSVTGCEVVSDSSKSLHKLSLINRLQDLDLKIIYLYRHVGGVAASHKRKGRGPYKYGLSWVVRNLKIANYVKRSGRPWIDVGYENLAEDPVREMERVFRFIDADFEADQVNDFTKVRHIVKGNRIRDRHTELTFRKPSIWQKSFGSLSQSYFRTLNSLVKMARG